MYMCIYREREREGEDKCGRICKETILSGTSCPPESRVQVRVSTPTFIRPSLYRLSNRNSLGLFQQK